MRKTNLLFYFIALLFILLLPFLISNEYYLEILMIAGINTITVLGLTLLIGYAGQVSLGHAGFYGLGAYTSSLLAIKIGINPWLSIFLAILLTIFLAFLIGYPTLKLKGHYLAMATLGFGVIFFVIFNSWRSLTGGANGLINIPNLSIFSFKLDTDFRYYYLVWIIVLLLYFFVENIIRTDYGRTLRSLHSNELAASVIGINTSRVKLQVFIFSATLASLSGSLYAHKVTFIEPTLFTLHKSILFLTMAIIGGVRNIRGALIGAIFLTLLPEILRVVGDYDVLVYGFLLVIILLFFPNGIFGLYELIRNNSNNVFQKKVKKNNA